MLIFRVQMHMTLGQTILKCLWSSCLINFFQVITHRQTTTKRCNDWKCIPIHTVMLINMRKNWESRFIRYSKNVKKI